MPIVAYPFTDQQYSSTKLTPASDIKNTFEQYAE